MKKTLVFVAAMLYLASTPAQQPYRSNKPVMCDSLENVSSTMKDKYGEEPIWYGEDLEGNGKYVMLANLQTRTWTFVQFTKDWACVLGVGTGSAPMKVGVSV